MRGCPPAPCMPAYHSCRLHACHLPPAHLPPVYLLTSRLARGICSSTHCRLPCAACSLPCATCSPADLLPVRLIMCRLPAFYVLPAHLQTFCLSACSRGTCTLAHCPCAACPPPFSLPAHLPSDHAACKLLGRGLCTLLQEQSWRHAPAYLHVLRTSGLLRTAMSGQVCVRAWRCIFAFPCCPHACPVEVLLSRSARIVSMRPSLGATEPHRTCCRIAQLPLLAGAQELALWPIRVHWM